LRDSFSERREYFGEMVSLDEEALPSRMAWRASIASFGFTETKSTKASISWKQNTPWSCSFFERRIWMIERKFDRKISFCSYIKPKTLLALRSQKEWHFALLEASLVFLLIKI
jgi:hypothetical protein